MQTETEGPYGTSQTISREELHAFIDERRRSFWLICMTVRPCVHVFASYVEYSMYPPKTERNASFELLEIPWEGLMYHVFGMPVRDMVEVRAIANACGLKIKDGVPTMIAFKHGQPQQTFFPMNTRRCFTLENDPKWLDQPFSPHQQQRILEAEQKLCERIWKGWKPTRPVLRETLQAMLRNVRNGKRA